MNGVVARTSAEVIGVAAIKADERIVTGTRIELVDVPKPYVVSLPDVV